MKLKNASASPRFDRLIGNAPNSNHSRPILKSNSHVSQPSQSSSDVIDPETSAEPVSDAAGYTPSGLQRKVIKDLTRGSIAARNAVDTDNDASAKTESFSNENENSTELAKSSSRSIAKPIVPSHFSPIRHKSYEDTSEVTSMILT